MRTLTRIKKGKALGIFDGFADTFNYIVDFVENLRGDGDTDDAKAITIDRTVDDHPVIRSNGGTGEVTITGTDDSSATGSSIAFASAADSNVSVSVAKSGDTVTVTVGVHWV